MINLHLSTSQLHSHHDILIHVDTYYFIPCIDTARSTESEVTFKYSGLKNKNRECSAQLRLRLRLGVQVLTHKHPHNTIPGHVPHAPRVSRVSPVQGLVDPRPAH